MAGPLRVPAGHREHVALCAGLRQVCALHLQTWDQMGLGGWTSGGRSFCWAGPAGRVGLPPPATGPGHCSSSERLSTSPRVSLTSSSPGEGITEKQVPGGQDLNINVPPETTGHPKDTGFAKVPPYEPRSIYKHSLSVCLGLA